MRHVHEDFLARIAGARADHSFLDAGYPAIFKHLELIRSALRSNENCSKLLKNVFMSHNPLFTKIYIWLNTVAGDLFDTIPEFVGRVNGVTTRHYADGTLLTEFYGQDARYDSMCKFEGRCPLAAILLSVTVIPNIIAHVYTGGVPIEYAFVMDGRECMHVSCRHTSLSETDPGACVCRLLQAAFWSEDCMGAPALTVEQ